ncbi:MAG: hypothetical protein ACPLZY_02255 [Candidatus Norongarragalinales archaeon]
MFRKTLALTLILTIATALIVLFNIRYSANAWSNGGFSDDPSNPDYGTHDWIAHHALDWLPDVEK